MRFEFIETSVYRQQIEGFLSDDEHQSLQNLILDHPHVGVVVQKTGGARKLRFGINTRGKRGGLRIVYAIIGDFVVFLMAYQKTTQVDLTPENKRALREFLGGKQ